MRPSLLLAALAISCLASAAGVAALATQRGSWLLGVASAALVMLTLTLTVLSNRVHDSGR